MNSEKATSIPYLFSFFFFYSNVKDTYILFCDFKFYGKKKEMQNASQTTTQFVFNINNVNK